MEAFMGENPEYLLGDQHSPGPLVIFTYPEVLCLRLVSTKLRDIINEDYFWKLKTHRDFGAKTEGPKEGKTWKEEYREHFREASYELITASKRGDVDRVRELLDFGVNPNIQNKHGSSALIWASWFGHPKIVEMLLTAGSEVDLQHNTGRTALMYASQEGHSKIIEMLLAAGVDVNHPNKYGETALAMASLRGHSEIVDILKRYMQI